MALDDDLFGIEEGFWLRGSEHFLEHVDLKCLLAFPQAGEMHGVFDREQIAATATPSNRWRDLRMSNRQILSLEDVVIISYKANVTRADGSPTLHWSVLVTSAAMPGGSSCSTSIRPCS